MKKEISKPPSGSFAAQAEVPPLVSHITDQTGTLSPAQKTSLEQLLSEFEARKGSQIAVLIVASPQPEAIEQYALRVAEQWKLGRKKVDDGVVVLVAKNDRTMRIEVGYGLEGALSDITSKRMLRGAFSRASLVNIEQAIRLSETRHCGGNCG